MTRNKLVSIDQGVLNSKLLSKYGADKPKAIDALATTLNVSKPTIYRWMSESKLPANKLLKIRRELSFNSDEFKSLIPTKRKFNYSFRKKRGHDGLKKYHDVFEELCLAISFVEEIPVLSNAVVLSQLDPSLGEHVIGNAIKGILEIPEAPMYSDIERSLHNKGIQTFFFPFELLATSDEEKLELLEVTAVAVKSSELSKVFIIHNSNRTLKEAAFDLIHELTHLLVRPGVLEHDEEENFCNNVAKNFFLSKELAKTKYKGLIEEGLREGASNPLKAISLVNKICDEVNIDYIATILRLTELRFIEKKSEVEKILWGNYYKNIAPRRVTVQGGKSLDHVNNDFWFEQLFSEDKNRFNRLFRAFYNSYNLEKLSSRYVSWLFSVSHLEIDKFKESI